MPASNRIACLLSGPLAVNSVAEGGLKELPLLDTDKEREQLESALREGCRETGSSFELEVRYATLDALRSVLTLGARCIHFAGHGHPNWLCFEDLRGGAVALSTGDLKRFVGAGGCKTRLVIINSCHSQKAGQAFVEAGVPHVVAVSSTANADGRVSDRAATAFCRAFYLAVISGRTVRQAFEIGSVAAASTSVARAKQDQMYVLLPFDDPHDECVFADAPKLVHSPQGCLQLSTQPKAATNAPPPPTSYVGRGSELASLVEAILRHRLTTVAGAFGCGKSALVSAAAEYVSDRGHFDAVVWVKVTTRDRLLFDVLETVADVLETTRMDMMSSSNRCDPCLPMTMMTRLERERSSNFFFDDAAAAAAAAQMSDGAGVTRQRSRSMLLNSPVSEVTMDSNMDPFYRSKRLLIVLDDFERLLVAPPRQALKVRQECQRALSWLLSSFTLARIVLTCSKASGIGGSTSVSERVVTLGPLEPDPAARLLLHRSPELLRRTSVIVTQASRGPLEELVRQVSSHLVLLKLSGNPFALALAATLLNSVFELDDAAAGAAMKALRAENRFPEPLTQTPPLLEPLDRLLRVLTQAPVLNDAVSRIAEEINFVLHEGTEFFATPQDRYIEGGLETGEEPLSPPQISSRPRLLRQQSSSQGCLRSCVQRQELERSVQRQEPDYSRDFASLLTAEPPNDTANGKEAAPDSTTGARRFQKFLAVALLLIWSARLVFDALEQPKRAGSVRLDVVLHLVLDVVLLASLVVDSALLTRLFDSMAVLSPTASSYKDQ